MPPQVSVVVPNYNGIKFLPDCLESLRCQTFSDFETVLVDNGSEDESLAFVREHYPWVRIIALDENYGFCRAVNEGIRGTSAPLVILLNNDTKADPAFVEKLYEGMQRRPKTFSASACMLQFQDPSLLDDGGDFYNALGWAFARGKGKPADRYMKEIRIFAACGGAAIYRRSVLEEIGIFDEKHFAYLEDIDLGYRARLSGWENRYFPEAKVLHVGSGTSGSRYNDFKTGYSARNNVFLIYKNMAPVQWVINFPFLAAGFALKRLFFRRKGLGEQYMRGLKEGRELCRQHPEARIRFRWKNTLHYVRIQFELWGNIFRRR